MPSLAKLYNEFQEKNFVILAIDIQEKREIVKKYVKQEKLPFPILMDFTGQVASKYGGTLPVRLLLNMASVLILPIS
jgi:peroxiredoxin